MLLLTSTVPWPLMFCVDDFPRQLQLISVLLPGSSVPLMLPLPAETVKRTLPSALIRKSKWDTCMRLAVVVLRRWQTLEAYPS